jgi:hypothetical protein
MTSIGDSISKEYLVDLITTRENSYKLFKYQMSLLNKEGKELYADFLQRNLTEEKIDKILETYFKEHYQNKTIESIVLLKKPFIKTEPLTNEEKHKANEQFLNRKLNNLTQIYREVNNIDISAKEIIKNRVPKHLTFRYRFKNIDAQLSHIADLYSRMIVNGFIEDNTPNGNNTPKFKAIFKGSNEVIPFENRIIWTGSDYQLKHFITILRINKIIEEEYHNRWTITANCFRKRTKDKITGELKTVEFVSEKFAKTTAEGSIPELNKINKIIIVLMKDLKIAEQFIKIEGLKK